MTRPFRVVSKDGETGEEVSFEEAAIAEIKKLVAKGTTVLVLVGEVAGNVEVVSLPNSGALEFGLMTIALHSYSEPPSNDAQ